jgi:hypothetical protein
MLEILVTFLIFCLSRIRGLWYLARGPEIIDKAYIAAEGKPFKISTPSNDHLLVTSNEHIAELVNAPLQNLSLHAVAKEVCPLVLLKQKVTQDVDSTAQIHHVWL